MTNIKNPDGTAQGRLVFGTMQWGGGADEAVSHSMYDLCRAAGITHFDTAYNYNDGASERLLGKFASSERDKLIIATKVAYLGGASGTNIRAQFDECRCRLNMDSVDILYLHKWNEDTPLEETFEALADLQSKGLFRHIGVSNFAAWQVVKAQGVAQKFNTRIDILQPMYNLVKRQAEVEILPMAHAESIDVASYSPLGGGLLTGKYTKGETGRLTSVETYEKRYSQDWMHAAAAALSDLSTDLEVSPATLAVAWVAAHPTSPQPIISARTLAQLSPSLAAAEFEMTDALYVRLSSLTPAPPPATDRLEEA